MGERCYLEIKFQELDTETVCEELGEDPHSAVDYHNKWKLLTIDQCNWAADEERLALAENGIQFFGHHGSVQNQYNASIFASNGDGTLYQVPCTDLETMQPFIPIPFSGVISKQEIETTQTALQVYNEMIQKTQEPIRIMLSLSSDDWASIIHAFDNWARVVREHPDQYKNDKLKQIDRVLKILTRNLKHKGIPW